MNTDTDQQLKLPTITSPKIREFVHEWVAITTPSRVEVISALMMPASSKKPSTPKSYYRQEKGVTTLDLTGKTPPDQKNAPLLPPAAKLIVACTTTGIQQMKSLLRSKRE